MDDRKKRIDDLLKNNQENRSSLDTLLENFGENLYSRSKNLETDLQANFEDISQYNDLLRDIADSNAAIARVEEKSRRFKELEESIEVKEQEEKERARELSGIYRKLGKAMLENNDYNDSTSAFREQANALAAKLESLEARINELDGKEKGNVFSWIGKSAQGLVLKSFLSKAQENQEQLYQSAGEQLSSLGFVSHDDGVTAIREEIDNLRKKSRSAADEILKLKDEKRIISAGFGIDGNPQKQIQTIKNHITENREELRKLYRNFGSQASGILDIDKPERKYFIDTIVTAEDGETIGRAARLNQAIFDNEKAIGKLRASISIDEEKNKIEKYKKSIQEKKDRIADLEHTIKDLGKSIHDAENFITELEKQL
ncbi:MAG: hypothetical protein LBI12_04365 [Treponema sp.]|jgi:DNA repair exonuclease SbcCD ATPase subunit|nr:hypothetical protein [Treponema sp.]